MAFHPRSRSRSRGQSSFSGGAFSGGNPLGQGNFDPFSPFGAGTGPQLAGGSNPYAVGAGQQPIDTSNPYAVGSGPQGADRSNPYGGYSRDDQHAYTPADPAQPDPFATPSTPAFDPMQFQAMMASMDPGGGQFAQFAQMLQGFQQMQQAAQQQQQPTEEEQQQQQQELLAQLMAKTPNVKPGDWFCTLCQTHNFANKMNCFKCQQGTNPNAQSYAMGAPMPGRGSGSTQDIKPGDWFCPSCNYHNFATKSRCTRCSTNNPNPDASVAAMMKPGDWMCQDCNAHNFANKSLCFKCRRGVNPSEGGAQSFGGRGGGGGGGEGRPGDWNCGSCGGHNFASRFSCFKCNKPKQEGGR